MIIVGMPRRGSLKVFKNPADAQAPCRLHKAKYGEPFTPDVDPNYWDE